MMKRVTSYLSLAGIALTASLALAPLSSTPAAAAPAASTVDMMRAIQSASPVEQVHGRRHWHRRHCGWKRSCWRGRYGRLHCRPVYRCWR